MVTVVRLNFSCWWPPDLANIEPIGLVVTCD